MSRKKKTKKHKKKGAAGKAAQNKPNRLGLVLVIALAALAVVVVLVVVGARGDQPGEDSDAADAAENATEADVADSSEEAGDADGDSATEEGDAESAEEADEVANDTAAANPVAVIEMEEGGIIKVELDPQVAPNTVRNFIYLAAQGFYDGLIFHRVIDEFMIQGGCPQGTGTGGPGYSIKGEFTANDVENPLSHERGVISMARSNPFDSAGSQFFITVAPSLFLDDQYAAFGRVIEGMEVTDRIATVERNPANDRPLQDQRIKTITIETFGVEYEPPEKM